MNRKTIAVLTLVMLAGLSCFNKGRHWNIMAENRFEVATASVVLGAGQLLVDTSNGDVWMLDGERAPSAQWVLLARGPDDVRNPPPIETGDLPSQRE